MKLIRSDRFVKTKVLHFRSDHRSIKKKQKTSNGETSKRTSDSVSSSESQQLVDETENKSRKTPTIVIFDSLRSGTKNRVGSTIREFLQLEYDHKKTLPDDGSNRKIFNVNTIELIEAAVPQQPNYFDCGLYILQYIEKFFAQSSLKIDFRSPETFSNWCETKTMGSSKRKEIFEAIREQTLL